MSDQAGNRKESAASSARGDSSEGKLVFDTTTSLFVLHAAILEADVPATGGRGA
jgi:hypothetical protein